jgi:hypothetical protein
MSRLMNLALRALISVSAAFTAAASQAGHEVRLIRSVSGRVIVRFSGAQASRLHKQFVRNYHGTVRGTVDGKDVACLLNHVKEGTQNVCAFFLNRKGQISNVFDIKPSSDEMVSAVSVLYGDGQMEAELKPGTFAARSLKIVRSGSDSLRGEVSNGAYAFRVRGDDAEILFNYLRFGHLKKMGTPTEFNKSGTLAVRVERADFACGAERMRNGRQLPMKVEYACEFAFDARGSARSMGTLEPRISIIDGFKDEAPRILARRSTPRTPSPSRRSLASVARTRNENSTSRIVHISCPACVPAVSIQNLTSSVEPR